RLATTTGYRSACVGGGPQAGAAKVSATHAAKRHQANGRLRVRTEGMSDTTYRMGTMTLAGESKSATATGTARATQATAGPKGVNRTGRDPLFTGDCMP